MAVLEVAKLKQERYIVFHIGLPPSVVPRRHQIPDNIATVDLHIMSKDDAILVKPKAVGHAILESLSVEEKCLIRLDLALHNVLGLILHIRRLLDPEIRPVPSVSVLIKDSRVGSIAAGRSVPVRHVQLDAVFAGRKAVLS